MSTSNVYVELFVANPPHDLRFGAAAFVRSQIAPLGTFEGNMETDAAEFKTWLDSVSKGKPALITDFHDAVTATNFPLSRISGKSLKILIFGTFLPKGFPGPEQEKEKTANKASHKKEIVYDL